MWTIQPSATNFTLTGVWTLNGVNFIAVGLAGAIIVSSDAGSTWVGQITETSRDLFAVHFTDIDRGTIVGDRGIILRTLLAGSLPSGVGDDQPRSIPNAFLLAQNYPNPFNGTTTIEFHLARYGNVSLRVYDLLGREVKTLLEENRPPGLYKVRWDTKNAPSGVYFCRLHVAGAGGRADQSFVATTKMILTK
jgi:hypothetical protein